MRKIIFIFSPFSPSIPLLSLLSLPISLFLYSSLSPFLSFISFKYLDLIISFVMLLISFSPTHSYTSCSPNLLTMKPLFFHRCLDLHVRIASSMLYLIPLPISFLLQAALGRFPSLSSCILTDANSTFQFQLPLSIAIFVFSSPNYIIKIVTVISGLHS